MPSVIDSICEALQAELRRDTLRVESKDYIGLAYQTLKNGPSDSISLTTSDIVNLLYIMVNKVQASQQAPGFGVSIGYGFFSAKPNSVIEESLPSAAAADIQHSGDATTEALTSSINSLQKRHPRAFTELKTLITETLDAGDQARVTPSC